MEANNSIQITDWYTASQAAKAIGKRSHRVVKPVYLRSLVRLDKIRAIKLGARTTLYSKEDVDAYRVEDRGKKVARAQKARAKERRKAKQPIPA